MRSEKPLRENLAFALMHQILEVIKESGASEPEARSAIKAAKAMLPELDLATYTIETRATDSISRRLETALIGDQDTISRFCEWLENPEGFPESDSPDPPAA